MCQQYGNMENVASIKDGDMDYLVWNMLSF